MTPIQAAWKEIKECDIIAQDTFSGASQRSSVLFLRSAKNSKGDIRGFPNWDWKISKGYIGVVSELVDHVNAAECSGNARDWVVFKEIQGKCVGQRSRWPVVSSRKRVVECQPAQWHASCARFRNSRSFRCFDDGKAHCITAFEKGCPFPTVPDHCKGQSLERSSCYIVLIVLWSSWQFM